MAKKKPAHDMKKHPGPGKGGTVKPSIGGKDMLGMVPMGQGAPIGKKAHPATGKSAKPKGKKKG